MRLIDSWNLCEYANNQKDKSVDANDIMRMPVVEAVPLKPLAAWLAGYAAPPRDSMKATMTPGGFVDHESLTAAWEMALREMRWEGANDRAD